MTDKELLELAAKAAGLNWKNWTPTIFLGELELREWPYDWNPLENNADAFELMVKLNMDFTLSGKHAAVAQADHHMKQEYCNGDSLSASRRAIVRAAAEIGKGM